MNRSTFDLIESAAERDKRDAIDSAYLISRVIAEAMGQARRIGWPLNGADPAERVAEALAVWMKESAPRRFADMTATRYSVTGVDCSAPGMERLRDQSEFICLAYPDAEATPESLAAEWIRDMESSDQSDGFDYGAAAEAIRAYASDAADYLRHKLAEESSYAAGCNESGLPADEWDGFEPAPFRLYVRDNAPESDK